MQNNTTYTMEALVPVMLDFFKEDKKVIISATGNSMAPLIRHKKDSIVLVGYKGEALEVGDLIFYKRKSGRCVLHRIIDKAPDGTLTTLGDNQTSPKETVLKEQIFALPVAIVRGGKEFSLNSKSHNLYKALWRENSLFRIAHIGLFMLKIKAYRFIKNK